MSTSLKRSLLLSLTIGLLALPLASWPQALSPASGPKVEALPGKLPPFCETCGTVIAINRVSAEEAAARAPAASKAKPTATKRVERFEVVVRLSAGTQQVVSFDVAPQLTIGQKVRITDGLIIPELG